jgi:leader peptidase (prepilin peptidase)/N-methyltransferase
VVEGEPEEEWVPGPTNMPFGPWIGLAALEVLLLRPWLQAHLQPSSWTLSIELLFGL